MKKPYKILSEKYEQVLGESDTAKAGLNALSNEINLINLFQFIGDLPEDHAETLNQAITNYAHSLTDTIAADTNTLDDDLPDYEPEVDEYQNYMHKGVVHAFKHHAQEIAIIAPGLTEQEALDAVWNWEG